MSIQETTHTPLPPRSRVIRRSFETRQGVTSIELQDRGDRGAAQRTPPFRWWSTRAVIVDVVAAVLGVVVAQVVRFGTEAIPDQPLPYEVVGPAIIAVWLVALVLCGAYLRKAALFGVEEARSVCNAGVALLAVIGVIVFFLQIDLSRAYLGVLVPMVLIFTVLGRWPLRLWFRHRQAEGVGQLRAVVVGPAQVVDSIVARLTRRPGPVAVVAMVYEDSTGSDPELVCAELERLHAPGGVDFDLVMRAGKPVDEESWMLADLVGRLGVDFAIAPSHTDDVNLAFSYVPIGSTPILLVKAAHLRPVHRVVKATFDWVFAVLATVLLAPLLLAIAAVILVRDGRPVLFRQDRVGQRGTTFSMWKFRTMTVDAEQHRAALQELNEADGPLFKLRHDPRITPTGAILRRWSLDELPQLMNVLRGDMAIVGPRPFPVGDATYDARTIRRLLVKPGLTGLWQVDGRSDLPWDEAVYLDLVYVDHWSPILDAAILVRTFRAVVRRDGAY